MKSLAGLLLLLLSSASCAAIALSGIVQDNSGTGLAKVTISLAHHQELTVTSSANGTFNVTDQLASVQKQQPEKLLQLQNTRLNLQNVADSGVPIAIALYSSNGRQLFSRRLAADAANIDLPRLAHGIYLLVVSVGGTAYRTWYAPLGNLHGRPITLFDGTYQITPAFQHAATVVDTLIAERDGFVTAHVPLSSYTAENLTIVLTSKNEPQNRGLSVYFIRHAETVANASGEIGGGGAAEDHDTLTALGDKQVSDLKTYLMEQGIHPDFIVASPSLRTQRTIDPYLAATGQKAEIWVELNECCGEDPSGDPLPTERPELRWKIKIDTISDNFSFRSSEESYFWYPQTYEEGLFMVMTARDRLLSTFGQSGKTVIMVGHAVNGSLLLGLLRGYDMLTTNPDRPVYLQNTGVQLLTQDTLTGIFSLKQNINKPVTN